MMRFQAVRDPSVLLDLCMECFQLYAMATVHDEPALAQLHRLARVSRGEVWRSGSAFYLLRGQASNA